MERLSQSFGFHKAKEPPVKKLTKGQETINRVFYGVGSVGKLIESQSPRAWNERIIKVINTKILPKLTPEQLMAVAKHHTAIEVGARVAGIAVSTAELYSMFLLARLGKRQIDRLRLKRTYEKGLSGLIRTDGWFQELRQKYMGISGHSPEQFTALAGSLAFLTEALLKENKVRSLQHGKMNPQSPPEKPKPGLIGVLARASNPKQAEESLREAYHEAHRERVAYEAFLRGKRAPSAAEIDKDADALFAGWQATRFYGAEGLLEAAGVQNHRARRVYRNVQGIPSRNKNIHIPVPSGEIKVVVDAGGIQRIVRETPDIHADHEALQAIAEHGWQAPDFQTERRKGRQIRARIPAQRFTHQG